jgi:hypothetical protein
MVSSRNLSGYKISLCWSCFRKGMFLPIVPGEGVASDEAGQHIVAANHANRANNKQLFVISNESAHL